MATMNTDRDLLLMAAKAAGMTEDWSWDRLTAFRHGVKFWNPLTEDGEALQLATLLGLSIQMDAQLSDGLYVVVTLNNVQGDAPLTGDRNAAVRRAIVSAAAEIGNLMP